MSIIFAPLETVAPGINAIVKESRETGGDEPVAADLQGMAELVNMAIQSVSGCWSLGLFGKPC